MTDTNYKPFGSLDQQKSDPSKPWLVNRFPISGAVPLPSAAVTITETVQEMPLNFRNSLRATIDEVNAKEYEGMVNAPRPLPKLNVRQVYEFPLHCLPETIRDAAESIAVITQCHPDIAVQVAIGYVSLAIQGHADVLLPWNNTVVPSSLFLVTVADSSDRKTSADKQISPVVARWEKELMKRYRDAMPLYQVQFEDWSKRRAKIMADPVMASEQKDKEIGPAPRKPRPPILISDNPTIEGLRDSFIDGSQVQGLFSDDGGTFLGGHSMKAEQVTNTISSLSKMFSADLIKKLRAGGVFGIAGSYRLATHLMIQPVIANRFLNDKLFRGQGLLSRFLTSWPDSESLSGYRESQDVDPSHYANVATFNNILWTILSTQLPIDLVTGELQPRVLRFTPEADKMHKDWNDSNQRHLRVDGKYYAIKDFVGKGLEQAARFAANLEMFENKNATHVSGEWFRKSTEIVDYYINQQDQSVTNGNGSDIVNAHKLYNFLNDELKCDHEYVTTRYLARCSPFRSVEEVKPVIKTLEEFGLLQDAGKGHLVDGYIARQAWKVNRGYDS